MGKPKKSGNKSTTSSATTAVLERRASSDDALSGQESGNEVIETVDRGGLVLGGNGVTTQERHHESHSADGLKHASESERVTHDADGRPIHREAYASGVSQSLDGSTRTAVSKHEVSSVSGAGGAAHDLAAAHHAEVQAALASRNLALSSPLTGAAVTPGVSFANALSHHSSTSSSQVTTSHVTHTSSSHVTHSSTSSSSTSATRALESSGHAVPAIASPTHAAGHNVSSSVHHSSSSSTTTTTSGGLAAAPSSAARAVSPSHSVSPSAAAITATHVSPTHAHTAPLSSSYSSSSSSTVKSSTSSATAPAVVVSAPTPAPAPAPAPAATAASSSSSSSGHQSSVTTTTTRSVVSSSSAAAAPATPARTVQSSTTYEFMTPRTTATSSLARIALTPQRLSENDPSLTEIQQRSFQVRQTREQIASQSQKAISTITELLERSAASPARARSLDHSHLNCPICTSGGSLVSGPCSACKEKDHKIAELEARIKSLEARLAVTHTTTVVHAPASTSTTTTTKRVETFSYEA